MVNEALTLVIISYYDRRSIDNLVRLLNSMEEFDPGANYSVCVVVNRTSDKIINLENKFSFLSVLYRNNTGMNIGAWDYGWRMNPDHKDYLFLQDECYMTKNGWLSAFKDIAQNSSIGMIGESINESWNQSWDMLREKQKNINLSEHELNGVETNRVDVYLSFMRDNDILPGMVGRHLRSLVWYIQKDVLNSIGGFPIGSNYGECIAAEISVSKKVESLGKTIVQVSKSQFEYIRHIEWNKDCVNGNYSHKPIHLTEQNILKNEIDKLNQLINSPSWEFIIKLINNKLRGFVKSMLRRIGI